MNKSGIAPQQLSDLLRYDEETGRLFWRDRPDEHFRSRRAAAVWRSKCCGKEAFTATAKNGYRVGAIWDRTLYAHRVIFAMVHGYWPNKVDHINGDRSDNRLSNLRAVSDAQNAWNSCVRSSKEGAILGVDQASDGRWRARINRKQIGSFKCQTAAAVARRLAELREYGEYARGAL